jgi:hypothetical protein
MIMKNLIIGPTVCFCVLFSAIYASALTPQQVLELKKAGVSDQTIQMMIKQEEAAKDDDTMGTREVKDEDGNTVIIYSTGKTTVSAAEAEEAKNVERAWQMLQNMNIKVDKRNITPRR